MEPDKSEHLYTVHFDERQEAWYVQTGSARLPLSRWLLQHLVALYNSVHRGSPLTLIDRRAMEELGRERSELADAAPTLQACLTAEATRSAAARCAAGDCLNRARRRAQRLVQRLLARKCATTASSQRRHPM